MVLKILFYCLLFTVSLFIFDSMTTVCVALFAVYALNRLSARVRRHWKF